MNSQMSHCMSALFAATGRATPLILEYQKSGASPTGYHSVHGTGERSNETEIQPAF
jgi:hypothetical protein